MKAKGSTKRKEREPIDKLDPELNEHEVEMRSLDGRYTKIEYVACLICGGRVKSDGRDEGGLLRYSYVNKLGQVREAMATCPCEIGTYIQERAVRGRFKVQRYADLPEDLRLPIQSLETEAQVRDFNRRKFAELCRKVRQSHRDPDTQQWIEYGQDVNSKPTVHELTDPELAMGAVTRVLERVYKQMKGKGLPLPDYKKPAKAAASQGKAPTRPAQHEPSNDPTTDRDSELVPAPAAAGSTDEEKGDYYDDDGLPF